MVEKLTYFSVKKIYIYLYLSIGVFDQKLTLITISGSQGGLKMTSNYLKQVLK